jgi:hypothetical protein
MKKKQGSSGEMIERNTLFIPFFLYPHVVVYIVGNTNYIK